MEICPACNAVHDTLCCNACGKEFALEDKAPDAVVEANVSELRKRSRVGLSKYGVTLAGSALTRRALLQHALEEALDLANYLRAELMREDSENAEANRT